VTRPDRVVASPDPPASFRRDRILGHQDSLDGLRAVAVTLVLLFHGGAAEFQGGFLGVSVFFTLSGFLITNLLLRRWFAEGRLDTRGFWGRRLRRLAPAAWCTIGLVLLVGLLGAWETEQLRSLRGDVPWSLVELVNWHFIATGSSYAANFTAPSPLAHFWSLAVEAQFYLVLLLVVVGSLAPWGGASRRTRFRRLVIALAVLLVASAAANLVLARGSIDRAYFGTDTRAAEMLAGALLACATARRFRPRHATARSALRWAAAAGLLVVIGLSVVATVESRWLYPWGLLLTAASSTAMIAGVLQRGWPAQMLSAAPVVALGRISYGVYLLHWPLFVWLTSDRTGLGTWPLLGLRVAITIGLATAMYRLLERPVRIGAWPSPAISRPLSFATVVVLLLATVAATSGLPAPPAHLQTGAEPELAIREAARPLTPTDAPDAPDASTLGSPPAPAPRRPTRILLVGDSIAASLQEALGEELSDRGVSFASAAVPGCGVVEGQPASGPGELIASVAGADTAFCSDAVPDLQRSAVDTFDPDLVVSVSTWERISRIVGGTFYEFGTPESDVALTELHRATAQRLSVGGARVVWALMPDTVPGRWTPPGQPDPEDLRRAEHHRNLLRALPDLVEGSSTVDLASVVCPESPCPAEVEGISLRPNDGIHFDEPEGARLVAERVADLLVSIDLDGPNRS
jgi:peptidoglycan/LPS O-acetylase OafA/YrhL